MNTTQETEFDYQTHMKENARGPSEVNRGTKAREKRREAAKAQLSQNGQLSRVLEKIQEIAEKSADGDYIYRGEPEHYEKVSSSLYRKYPESETEYFDIDIVQEEMIETAKGYTSETNDFEILTELQHYGGATNLIDFTTDYLIALFFTCQRSNREDVDGKNGRIILLKRTNQVNNWVTCPQNPRNRVIAQKSIFVRPPNGFIEPDHIVNIPKELKSSMLDYLRKYHGISTKTIYNDLHGFIKTLQTLNLNPQIAMIRAYYNIGNIKSDQGDHKVALECYSQVIQMYKDYPEPLMAFWTSESFFNRANAYMDLGQFKEAIKDYDEAICLKSKNASNKGTALFNKGNALVALGYFNEALQCYSESGREGMDSIGALENQRAVEKVIDIVSGRNYIVKTSEIPDCVLEVWITEYNGTENIPFTGRAGNTGNFPYMVDSDGKGFPGGRGFFVRIESKNR